MTGVQTCALPIFVGFVWLYFADDGAPEEAVTIRPGDGGYGCQIAALVCIVVFADNLLRRIEGPGENMLWVSSGRWELIVVSGMLSVLMQVLFWSGLRLWIPVLGEPTEGNGNPVHIPRRLTVFDEFLDLTSSIATHGAKLPKTVSQGFSESRDHRSAPSCRSR